MLITYTPTSTARRRVLANVGVRNWLLSALDADDYKSLLPRLERVTLVPGETVYRADQDIEEVYFPEDVVIAMVDRMENGRTVEVGVIGREGMVGINVVLGGAITRDRAVVQLAGSAMKMQSSHMREEIRFGGPLQRLLLAYARAFLAVISQTAACCLYHSIEQRVARWLLTMNEYADSREFQMNQHSIALMLGVRREGITEAAGTLQAAGLISYRRGLIRILDATGLERRACECYRFIRQEYRYLHGVMSHAAVNGAASRW